MKITLITQSEKKVIEGSFVYFSSENGRVGVGEKHEPSVWRLTSGSVAVIKPEESQYQLDTLGGVARVSQDGSVFISVDV